MTGFTLIESVAYEGSSLIGMFLSLEAISSFLKGHRVYCDELCDISEGREIEFKFCEQRLNAWNAPVGSTGCWEIAGRHDVTFVVYSFALSEEG